MTLSLTGKALAAALFIVVVRTASLFAQTKPAAANTPVASGPSVCGDQIQVRQLAPAWNQAEAHRDAAVVTAIVAGALMYIDFDGTMKKTEYIRDLNQKLHTGPSISLTRVQRDRVWKRRVHQWARNTGGRK